MQAYQDHEGNRRNEVHTAHNYEALVRQMDERKRRIEDEGGKILYRCALTKNQAKRLRKKGITP